jgi:hypothetical protein
MLSTPVTFLAAGVLKSFILGFSIIHSIISFQILTFL